VQAAALALVRLSAARGQGALAGEPAVLPALPAPLVHTQAHAQPQAQVLVHAQAQAQTQAHTPARAQVQAQALALVQVLPQL
jgi:hypothetical protein